MENLTEKDKHLWKVAKKRVEFKRHFATYIIISIFFWALWYFTDFKQQDEHTGLPWPIFPMLGWGIGILFHFMRAYMFPNRYNSIEKEYERLSRRNDSAKEKK
jgi:hypothetical protein